MASKCRSLSTTPFNVLSRHPKAPLRSVYSEQASAAQNVKNRKWKKNIDPRKQFKNKTQGEICLLKKNFRISSYRYFSFDLELCSDKELLVARHRVERDKGRVKKWNHKWNRAMLLYTVWFICNLFASGGLMADWSDMYSGSWNRFCNQWCVGCYTWLAILCYVLHSNDSSGVQKCKKREKKWKKKIRHKVVQDNETKGEQVIKQM